MDAAGDFAWPNQKDESSVALMAMHPDTANPRSTLNGGEVNRVIRKAGKKDRETLKRM